MEQTYSIERDLNEAEAMAEALTPYIYEDELYGKAGLNMPSLTVGALLLRLRRLSLLQSTMTAAQQGKLMNVEARHTAVRHEWRQHYEKKLTWEAESRLKAMQPYFEECRDNPRLCASAYLPEALRRTIVQDILAALYDLNIPYTALERQAKRTDTLLHGIVQPGDFVWDAQLQAAYPAETYWWLYHRPPEVNQEKPSH